MQRDIWEDAMGDGKRAGIICCKIASFVQVALLCRTTAFYNLTKGNF